MSFFADLAEKEKSKEGFNNLTTFFEEVRKAGSYEIDPQVEKIKKELEECALKLEDIFLDDYLIEKSEQKNLINSFEVLKERFFLSLDYPWMVNKKRVVVAGRFTAGKTSIINSLMKTNLPVDTKPTTAIPTQIANLNLENKAIIKTINYPYPKIINTEILNNLVKEEMNDFPIHIADIIEYIVINNDFLGDELIIIDTPGFDPADKKNLDKDKELMEKEFESADAIIWVMDINDGDISRDALEVLKTIKDKKLIVVLNKADTKIKVEIEKVVNKVKDTLIKNNISYEEIITMGKNTKRMNFDKNVEILRNLIKDLEVKEFNIFKEIKEFLDEIYLELIKVEKLMMNSLDIYENFYSMIKKEGYEGLKEIYNIDFEDELLKDFAKEVIEIEEELGEKESKIMKMWKLDVPWMGDDKYYILADEKEEFDELDFQKNIYYFLLGEVVGKAEYRINYMIDYTKEELEKVNNYIRDVNVIKKDLDEIEILYKKYQLK